MTKQEELYTAQKAFKEIGLQYVKSERLVSAMANYIYENMKECSDLNDDRMPSNYKVLRKRYGINIYGTGTSLAWYLLEKYFDGKLDIKE